MYFLILIHAVAVNYCIPVYPKGQSLSFLTRNLYLGLNIKYKSPITIFLIKISVPVL